MKDDNSGDRLMDKAGAPNGGKIATTPPGNTSDK
jgi:hypothetical protein